MSNPVSFVDDLDTEVGRLRRDLRLCQQRFDELQSTAEHELREAKLREVELRIENNNLKNTMRESAGALTDVLEGLGKLKG